MLCLPWALTGRCGSRGGLVVGLGGGGDVGGLLALSVCPSVCLSVWRDLKPCSRDHNNQVWDFNSNSFISDCPFLLIFVDKAVLALACFKVDVSYINRNLVIVIKVCPDVI